MPSTAAATTGRYSGRQPAMTALIATFSAVMTTARSRMTPIWWSGGRGGGLGVPSAGCQPPTPPTTKSCQECGAALTAAGTPAPAGETRFTSPDAYTPTHLARKILTARSSLAGERKKVTVLFADLKGSLELLADRDPEDARALLDAVLERMMEAVHRYEGTVNQVMGDGIMALFGAPVAHEGHALRAC